MQRNADLAVVGGGSTAISFLAQLIELQIQADAPVYRRILVFEPSEDIGPGAPYGDDLPTNLLNIPAGKMSVYANNRGHFLAWLRAQPASLLLRYGVTQFAATDFLPRPLFGQYLRDVWHELCEKAKGLGVELSHIQSSVESLSSVNDEICLGTPYGTYKVTRVVLCNGNLPSAAFGHLDGRGSYFNSPYPVRQLVERIPVQASVCVLGTSLSAVDAIVGLRTNGHKGKIIATSRNGRLPSVRSEPGLSVSVEPPRLEQFQALAKRNGGHLLLADVLDVLRERLQVAGGSIVHDDIMGHPLHPHQALNCEIAAAQTSQRLWQCVAISLNESIERVWHLLPDTERRRFYAEWRSLWMVRRATFPLENAMRLQSYIAEQTLQVVPRFESCVVMDDDSGYLVHVRDDKGARQTYEIDYVINATSFSVDVAQTTDSLILSLLKNGLASPDSYGGLRLDAASGCLIDSEGRLVPEVSLLGSLATGTYFWTVSLDVNSRLAFEQASRLVAERISQEIHV